MKSTEQFIQVRIFLPRSLYEHLHAKAKDTRTPLSRIVCYAIDNELDAPNPFYYPTPEPETVFVEQTYTEESKKIYTWLLDCVEGASRDMLWLSRRAIGLSKTDLALGIRELMHTGLVEYRERAVIGGRKEMRYRVIGISKDWIRNKKKEKLREQLKKMDMEDDHI